MVKLTEEQERLIDKCLEEGNRLKGKVSVPRDDREHRAVFPLTYRFVTEDLIRHYAEAVGDPNPLWRDPAYGRLTRWGTIIAPPTFDYAIAHSVVELVNFDIVPGSVALYAGTERRYYKVIRPGDEFRVVDRFLGVTEKTRPERPYRLFLMGNERTFINQRDEVVVVAVGRVMYPVFPPEEKDAFMRASFAGRTRPRFSKEQLEAVHQHYEEEWEGKHRRGADTRYWEDVAEGEELQPLIKGPLDITDLVSFASAIGLAWEGAFAMKWKLIKSSYAPERVDPVTGELHAPIDLHYLDSLAQQSGIPYAYGFGAQHEANIAHLITNWMGDDGFVKYLDLRQRAVLFQGEISTQKGKVVRKYIKEGEHLVDLEVWGENQDGVKHTVGTATVRLISRQQ